MNRENCSIISFYAISPIHAGSGASVATVDLPIQRERHTGFPHIQASGVKGAMRDHFRQNNGDKVKINQIFGSDEQDNWDEKKESLPGLISVSDAKLLAFPMRSNVAPFVWVTSPTILKRLSKDLAYVGISETFEDLNIKEDEAKIVKGELGDNKRIILEDVTVNLVEDATVNIKGKFESTSLKDIFHDVERLLLISDEMFDYCVSSCTEIQTNIKIDSEKGTAKDGGLRYQEFLPSDSVLYSVVYFSDKSKDLEAKAVKKYLRETIKDFLQVGGDITLGKGICKVNWIEGNTNGGTK